MSNYTAGWGVKKFWALLKYLRSDFVVNVLRTKQYLHRIRSIDRVDCPAELTRQGEPLTPLYVRVSYTAVR